MVDLDWLLISEARAFITGANVHRIKMLLFMYVTTVQMHNDGHPKHQPYDSGYEAALRKFVTDRRSRQSKSSR